MPIERTKASRVRRLIEKPSIDSTPKLASRQSGTVTAGISVARQLPRNRKMTSTTSTAASARVTQTPSMARSMNRLSSEPTVISIPWRQVRPDLLDHRLGGLGDGERVRAGLPDDAEADGRIAVQPEGAVGVFRPLLDAGDVAHADQIAVRPPADDEGAELLGRRERAVDAQGHVLLRRFEPPGGQLDILGPKRILDVGGGEPEAGEPLGPQPDPHRRPRLAADEDAGDAVDRGEAVDEVAVHPVGKLQRATSRAWRRPGT